jgi:2-(1,2-epoxy-1,2-dihydrophenyl)acetyl-CoA isomerase
VASQPSEVATAADQVLVSRSGGVVTVTLNQPERKNAVGWQMWQRLLQVFRELATDTDARVVVVTGAGGAFCSGADLASPPPAMHPMLQMGVINDVVLALHHLPMPTLARVDGDAVGAGFNLALACDLVVASDRSRFSAIFVKRGLSVDFGGSWILPRLIGLHRAKELCLTGDVIDAARADAIGLLNACVPVERLDSTVDDLVERLQGAAPIAQMFTKRLLNDGALATLAQAVDNEAAAQIVNLASSDSSAAREAFLERRAPVFTGGWPGRR